MPKQTKQPSGDGAPDTMRVVAMEPEDFLAAMRLAIRAELDPLVMRMNSLQAAAVANLGILRHLVGPGMADFKKTLKAAQPDVAELAEDIAKAAAVLDANTTGRGKGLRGRKSGVT